MMEQQQSRTSPIRDRTQHAIARHRAWLRPDVRRTYAGTSASSGNATSPNSPSHDNPLPQKQLQQNMYISPAGEAIYQEFESKEEEELYSSGVERWSTSRQVKDIAVSSVEEYQDYLHPLENQIISTMWGEPRGNHRATDQHMRGRAFPTTIEPKEERATAKANPLKSSYVYQSPYSSQAEERLGYGQQEHAYDYQSPVLVLQQQQKHLQQQQQQPIVYRDENESVVTGMSQQELLRKKARSVRRKERKFNKPKIQIVQLPSNLLHPVRISQPQQQYYVQAEESVGEEEASHRRSRWSKPRSSENGRVELESFSTTAATTNASGESFLPPQREIRVHSQRSSAAAANLGRFAAAVAKPSRQAPMTMVRGDNVQLVDSMERSLGEESFPMLTKNAGLEDDDEEEDRIMQQRQQHQTVQIERGTTTQSRNDASSSESTTSTTRRGVRFAEIFDDVTEESEMPWDQRTVQKSSPASVLEHIPEEEVDDKKPKSILRSPRFKPTPALAIRQYTSERRILDFESDRLLYVGDDDYRSPSVINYFDSEPRAMIVPGGARQAPPTLHANLDPKEKDSRPRARLGGSHEINSSLELPPPHDNVIFTDKDGDELSLIIQDENEEMPVITRAPVVPISHLTGHPAEKHLRGKLAKFLEMRGGEIADRVMEENHFPDPPLEIDMDDDDTDISAYVFIETVAAIVVQTAVRQFLAVLHVDSLRQTREAKELADRILSIENAYVKEVGVSTDRKRGSYIQKLKDVQTSFQSAGESGKDAKNLFEIAAMQIQAVYRGFWVRDCLDVDHFCITVIQSTWRGYSCRMKYYRDLERIIIVQSWWRRNIARDEAANILAHAIVIQANFRGHRVRTRYTKYRKREARVRKQTAASIVIQAAFKGYRVRTRYRKYQEPEVRAKEAAATIIQSRWRAFAGEALFIRTLVDVLIVQTVVRRWLAQTKMEVVRMKSQASNLKRKLNKNTTSRKDRNEAHINSATQNATAYSKSKILFGENIAATANAERKISMGVQVPYSNGQGSRSNLLQRDEPASYVSGYPLTGETSRLKTPVKLAENELGSRAESTGASYSFRANGPDVSINTCRKPSPLADPPGFVINRTNSGGRRREPASGGRAPTGNPSSNKVTKVSVVEHMMRDTAEDPLDSTPCLSHCLNEEATAANFGTSKVSKSAVVAYPTWDAREEPQGATSHPPHRADQDVTCGARRAQTLIKVQVPHQDNEHNVRGSMQRSAIPGVGGMSSLLLMWREKEKNNA